MIRKPAARCLCVLMCLALFAGLPPPARAAGGCVDIVINGERLNIPPSFGAPFYDGGGRLQIPMRYVIEACGYEVSWDGGARTAAVGTTGGEVVITLGSDRLVTPDADVKMDTCAVERDGRVYIPLRFVLEALGFTVEWTCADAGDTVNVTGRIGGMSDRKPMAPEDIAEQAAPAVFYIETFDAAGRPIAGGSGFFIDPAGIGVTNYHVLEGADSAVITAMDGTKANIAQVFSADADRDVAVFRVDGDAVWQYLNVALASGIRNGEPAYAIGSPLGLQNSITDGLVSNKSRTLPGDPHTYIQTSAPISHGNSGGPLLNRYAQVMGVNAATLEDGQNLNFAVPMSALSGVCFAQDAPVTVAQAFGASGAASGRPEAPVNLRIVDEGADNVRLQWDRVPGAEYYHLYYQEAGEAHFWYREDPEYAGPMRFYYGSPYTAEFQGLTGGHTYNVVVTALKNGVESAASRMFTFTKRNVSG